MPRVETTIDGVTKDAFHALAKRSGVTEAALLRRVIATLVRSNPSGPVNKAAEDRRSMRLSVGVTPSLFDAVTQAARDAHATRPSIVLGTLRSRFLDAPTLLPVEFEAVSKAAYEVGMVGINLNQLVRSLHQGQHAGLAACEQVVGETAASVDTLQGQIRRLIETATVRWGPTEGWE
jgi:GH24 family phage-related lysozyme (muramidase)